MKALKDPENPPSYRRIATQYNISDRTLRGRIQGTQQSILVKEEAEEKEKQD